ncbi:hypothetical protein HanXRQr2_Chr11g0484881 [Helianthus annuus]|uniref:Uncharacterized protein n=1 Tax=Helianthus annuus TaxID=4232 RepID=A0A9K3HNF5_HELAN|nr:hypothetical protein HanXRQr2_Chr11g0484881 [Helianthus annuus]KAJ0874647.1 hypothetical protein HanPSC8_Chr11g0466701 [Helianthus annuus]
MTIILYKNLTPIIPQTKEFVFSHGESSIFFEIRTRNVRLPKQA